MSFIAFFTCLFTVSGQAVLLFFYLFIYLFIFSFFVAALFHTVIYKLSKHISTEFEIACRYDYKTCK